MIRFARRIHLFVGITLGLTLTLLFLSGALLLVLESAEAREAKLPESGMASASKLATGKVLAEFARIHPSMRVRYFFPAHKGTEARVQTVNPNRTYLIHEKAGRVHFEEKPLGFRDKVREFHGSFGLSSSGKTAVGFHGLGLLLLIATGVLLWQPGKGQFRRSLKSLLKPNALRWRNVHLLVGVFALPVLFLIATTGATLALPGLVQWVSAPADQATLEKIAPEPGQIRSPIGQLLESAEQVLPAASTTRITLPLNPEDFLVVRKRHSSELHRNGMSFVYINPYTSKVVRFRDSKTAGPLLSIVNSRFPFHTGAYAGRISATLHAATAFSGAFLVMSGFVLWIQKLKRNKTKTSSAPQLPETRAE